MNKYKYLRQPFGKKHYNAKLSESEVRELFVLSQFIEHKVLSEAYHISVSTVHHIKTGARWKSVTKVEYASKIKRTRFRKIRKLTPIQVRNIRLAYAFGNSQNSLAKFYKVSQPVIFDIIHKRTHV